MKRFLHILRAVVILAILAAAVWLVVGKLRDFDREQFFAEFHKITYLQVFAAIALLGLNYVFLFCYDFLALKYIGHPLPPGKLALASFIGHVCSFNFGSLFGGAAARYRLYSAWKLSPLEILELVAILGVTFWLGVLALAGIVFLVDPFPIPNQFEIHAKDGTPTIVHLPFHDVRPLAVLLLTIVVVYLILCAVRRRPLKIYHWEIPLPHPKLSIAQISVASADLLVAAAIFFVLFPGDPGVGFLRFLGIFLLAWVVAAFAHVPGAVGVLEAVVLTFLCPEGGPNHDSSRVASVLAVLAVFRGIYYLLPLVLAGILFVGHEILMGRELLRNLHAGRTEPRAEPASRSE